MEFQGSLLRATLETGHARTIMDCPRPTGVRASAAVSPRRRLVLMGVRAGTSGGSFSSGTDAVERLHDRFDSGPSTVPHTTCEWRRE
jgi:hypothetical protein